MPKNSKPRQQSAQDPALDISSLIDVSLLRLTNALAFAEIDRIAMGDDIAAN